MDYLGKVGSRKVYYLTVRNNPSWVSSLPDRDWVVFTIANKGDDELIPRVARECINKNVSYTCSTGSLASKTEDFIDEEIAWRSVDIQSETDRERYFEFSPVTTFHKSLDEGFWFASTSAHVDEFEINKVVCLDLSRKNFRSEISLLIEKINSGWLPDD